MALFAHIETGRPLDVRDAPDAPTYRRWLNAAQNWNVVQVTDGTQSGDLPDGQGGWTHPATAPPPPPQPIKMSGKEFSGYCAAVLAAVNKTSLQDGLVRFDQIIAAMLSSTAPLMALAKTSYQAAIASGGRFTLDDVTTLIGALATSGAQGAPTQSEAAAIVANWRKE